MVCDLFALVPGQRPPQMIWEIEQDRCENTVERVSSPATRQRNEECVAANSLDQCCQRSAVAAYGQVAFAVADLASKLDSLRAGGDQNRIFECSFTVVGPSVATSTAPGSKTHLRIDTE